MKVIVVDRKPGEAVEEWPRVEFIPDSAPQLSVKPVFLPDEFGRWALELYAVVKIDRLGKSVETRFARRHYNTMTLGARLRLPEFERELGGNQLPLGIDCTWVTGQWVTVADQPLSATMTLTAKDGTKRVEQFIVDPERLKCDELISRISQLMILKTGDQIAAARMTDAVEVSIDDTVEVSLGSELLMKVKIK